MPNQYGIPSPAVVETNFTGTGLQAPFALEKKLKEIPKSYPHGSEELSS